MQVGNCENDMENHKGNITISRAKKVPVVNMLKGCFDFLFFFKQHSFRFGGSDSTQKPKSALYKGRGLITSHKSECKVEPCAGLQYFLFWLPLPILFSCGQ